MLDYWRVVIPKDAKKGLPKGQIHEDCFLVHSCELRDPLKKAEDDVPFPKDMLVPWRVHLPMRIPLLLAFFYSRLRASRDAGAANHTVLLISACCIPIDKLTNPPMLMSVH